MVCGIDDTSSNSGHFKRELERKICLSKSESKYETAHEIIVNYSQDNSDPNLLAVRPAYSCSIIESHTN